MTNNTFKYVSLFSGVGGFEQAMNKLGGKCVMSSEIDKFANQAYEVLYGHKTVGDVTKVAAGDVPDHDVLVGGFPCQAFSVAGKRLGFDDTRGTLFFEVARIAKEKRPKLLLLENVKGLISHDKGKTLDTIIKALNDIDYTVDFNVLNSKYFGVPQNRERIFIIGILNGETEEWKIEGNNVIAKGKKRISAYEGVKTFNFDWPVQDTVTTRLRDILEDEVDERYYLSEEKTAKLIAQLEDKENDVKFVGGIDSGSKWLDDGKNLSRNFKQGNRVYDSDGIATTLTSQSVGGLGGQTSLYKIDGGHQEPKIAVQMNRNNIGRKSDISHCLMARDYKGFGNQDMTGIIEEVRPVLTPDRIEKRQNGRRFKENDEPSFTLTAQDRHGVAIREATKQGYAIAEVGDSINVQFPNSKTRRGRIGKGVAQTLETSCNQATLVEDQRFLIDDQGRTSKKLKPLDISPTLRREMHGNEPRVVEPPSYRIRKLTPKECFRLQGFADSEFDKLVGAGISNSQLYKLAGNAVTVNVIEAIGSRLLKYLAHNEIGSRYVKGA
ncbi:DNA (cytosine-5-)-methyltransferase [Bacillus sp. XF8]|uniref:DNA (cytosine-5-)-methyltransferase n=1 Tax=Bacillus sp. XF8 TaxID=2819289 RepID=UPI001AA050F4|nr:DNA (cytosine-5-)-methyltransferase [Bacillus sp. XF8]MBO1582697.1 DNA (cytosine-5-)-methyltransferase [Bacillus sp. XF8]